MCFRVLCGRAWLCLATVGSRGPTTTGQAAVDKAIEKRGEKLLGRQLKLDYAEGPKPREW